MNSSWNRALLGIAIPGVVIAGGFMPYLFYRSELADRVATHFDGSGTPDGSMSPGQLVAVTTAMMAVGILPCVAIAAARKPLPSFSPSVASFVGGFVATLGAAILATTVIAQRGLDRWQQASLSPISLIVIIGSAFLVGATSARLASQLESSQPAPIDAVPSLELAPGEHAMWTGSLATRWPLAIGVVMVVAAVVFALIGPAIIAVVMTISAAAALTLSRIRVNADRTGLTVHYGFLAWPRTSIPADRINGASVIDVDPKKWGGWGYRGSLRLMRRAAVVLRAGPGIRLDLKDGRVFVVTIDDPTTAVAVLNAKPANLGR